MRQNTKKQEAIDALREALNKKNMKEEDYQHFKMMKKYCHIIALVIGISTPFFAALLKFGPGLTFEGLVYLIAAGTLSSLFFWLSWLVASIILLIADMDLPRALLSSGVQKK